MGKKRQVNNVFIKNERLIEECHTYLKERPTNLRAFSPEIVAQDDRDFLANFAEISELAILSGSDGLHFEMYREVRNLALTLKNALKAGEVA